MFAEAEAGLLLAASADAREPETALESLLARRVAGEPLEHVLGVVEFGGLRLSVGPGVFVPRQRSLLLARAAARAAAARSAPVVLECCSGAAPIAAYVARRVPDAELHAADLDAAALAHARRNLPADSGVHRGDGYTALPTRLRGRIDVIAAVPPYVPTGAAELLPREAREHEPPVALFAGEDGLDGVRWLVDGAPSWLRPGGVLLAELHRDQAAPALALARSAGMRARTRLARDGQTALLTATAG